MNTTKEMYIRQMGIDEKVYDYSQTLLENLKERFAKIDETAEYNQMKVVAAMQKNHVAEMHLNGTTGYGYLRAGLCRCLPHGSGACPSSDYVWYTRIKYCTVCQFKTGR